jgi:hypothetical protein
MNNYQRSKAKRIVAALLSAREASSLSLMQLRRTVAHMSPEQWQAVAFVAGVPVADLAAKRAVLELLP